MADARPRASPWRPRSSLLPLPAIATHENLPHSAASIPGASPLRWRSFRRLCCCAQSCVIAPRTVRGRDIAWRLRQRRRANDVRGGLYVGSVDEAAWVSSAVGLIGAVVGAAAALWGQAAEARRRARDETARERKLAIEEVLGAFPSH
jgi:hypothetical protein